MTETDSNRSSGETFQASFNKLEYKDCENLDNDDDNSGDEKDDKLNITPTPTTTINQENAPLCSSAIEKHSSHPQQHSTALKEQPSRKDPSGDQEIEEADSELNVSQFSTTMLNSSIMTNDDSDERGTTADEEQEQEQTVMAADTVTSIHPHPRQPLGVIKNAKNNLTICEDGQDETGSTAAAASGTQVMRLLDGKRINDDLLKEKDTIDSIGDVEVAATTSVSAPANTKLPETNRPIKVYETIEEFEANLPSTVTVLNTSCGSKVYLVGTAHFSEESKDDVSFVSILPI